MSIQGSVTGGEPAPSVQGRAQWTCAGRDATVLAEPEVTHRAVEGEFALPNTIIACDGLAYAPDEIWQRRGRRRRAEGSCRTRGRPLHICARPLGLG